MDTATFLQIAIPTALGGMVGPLLTFWYLKPVGRVTKPCLQQSSGEVVEPAPYLDSLERPVFYPQMVIDPERLFPVPEVIAANDLPPDLIRLLRDFVEIVRSEITFIDGYPNCLERGSQVEAGHGDGACPIPLLVSLDRAIHVPSPLCGGHVDSSCEHAPIKFRASLSLCVDPDDPATDGCAHHGPEPKAT